MNIDSVEAGTFLSVFNGFFVLSITHIGKQYRFLILPDIQLLLSIAGQLTHCISICHI